MFNSSVRDNKQYCTKWMIAVLLAVFSMWLPATVLAESETGSSSAITKKQSPAEQKAAEQKLRAAVKTAEEKHGQTSQHVLDTLKPLANHLREDSKQRKEYLDLHKRMVAISRALHGKNHPKTVNTLVGYGTALEKARNYSQAEPILKEALDIMKTTGEMETNNLLKIINSLGIIHLNTKRLESALGFFNSSLPAHEQLYGKDHPKLVLILDSIAKIYVKQGKHSNALTYYQRSLAIREKTLPSEHLDIASNLNRLAQTFREIGQYKKALPLYQRCLEIQEKALPEDHIDLAGTYNNLAALYTALGKYETALALFKSNLAVLEKNLPEDHKLIAVTLNNIAIVNEKMSRYEEALTYAKRSLAIREKLYTEDHPDVLSDLNNIAAIYVSMGEYRKALPLYQRSLKGREKVLREDHPHIANSLNNLAGLYMNMGEYAKALLMYERSFAIRERSLPQGHPDIAVSLNNLAVINYKMGQYTQALPYAQRSQRLLEKKFGKDHPYVASILNSNAGIYNVLGEYNKALELFKRSLAIKEKVLSPNHTDIAITLQNIADLYKKMKQFDKAVLLFKRSIAIMKKNNLDKHPKTAVFLDKLAQLHMALGEYSKVLPLFEQSLAIRQASLSPNHPDVADSMGNMADYYRAIGQLSKALELYRKSLSLREKILAEDHPSIAVGLDDLASLYKDIKNYEQALPLYKRSLAIREKTFPSGHPSIATALNNLAVLYDKMGKKKQAIDLHRRSLSILIEKYGQHHPNIVSDLNNVGASLVHAGDYEGALELFQRAIVILSNTKIPEQLWRTQNNMRFVLVRLRKNDMAIFWAKEAVNTIQVLRTGLVGLDKGSQKSFLVNKRHVYQSLADMLIAEGRIGEAQAVLQMLKEEELYDSLQRSSNTDPRSTRIELTGLERKRFAKYYELQGQQAFLGKERAMLERKQKLGEISAAEQMRLKEIKDDLLPPLRNAMLVFLKELQKQSDQYVKDKDYRHDEVRLEMVETNLQKAMIQVKRSDPDTKVAALQYVVTDSRLSILLSTPNNPSIARQIKYDGKALRTQIFTVRELLSNPKSDRDVLKKHLHELHGKLIAPIADDLKTLDAKTLVLVPNDVLRYVPFAALYDGKRYLIQDFTLTLFNEAVKKDFSKSSKAKWQLAAMGLTRAVENLPALTNVDDEVLAVATKSGLKGKIYLDDAFTLEVLTQSLIQNFNVLHLASHFEFVAGRPDASRLFLGDRSSLYLGDIARENMRFDKFSLVTFSACETGLGGGLDADGRDMESLGALVQNQGAGAVMATLWKVEDSSTASLMETFYRVRHEDKLHKAAALRKAQLKFIKRGGGRSVLAHPYYWAPFVLMGDWR